MLPLSLIPLKSYNYQNIGTALNLVDCTTNQAASTSTLIVPRLLAANMVGLSLFQHTALMKYVPASSSVSSCTSGDPNLCHVAGFEMAWEFDHGKKILTSSSRDVMTCILFCTHLVVHIYFICFTATAQELVVHSQTNKVLLICVSLVCSNLKMTRLSAAVTTNQRSKCCLSVTVNIHVSSPGHPKVAECCLLMQKQARCWIKI